MQTQRVAGILATLTLLLAGTGPIRADVVTTDFTLSPSGAQAVALYVSYSPAVDPISSLMVTSTNLSSVMLLSEPFPNEVGVTFTSANSGFVDFTFDTGATGVGWLGYSLTGAGSEAAFGTISVTDSPSSAPEPSSFALFGMAVTGLGLARWHERKQAA